MALEKQKIGLPIILDTVVRETALQFKQKGIPVVKEHFDLVVWAIIIISLVAVVSILVGVVQFARNKDA